MRKLKIGSMWILLSTFILLSCGKEEQSSSGQSKDESLQMVKYERKELKEKLGALKIKINKRLERVQNDLVRAEGEKKKDLAALNEKLIKKRTVLEDKLYQLDQVETDNWEEVRKNTQLMIDTLNTEIEKIEL